MDVNILPKCPKCGKPTKILRDYFLYVTCTDKDCTYIEDVLTLGVRQQKEEKPKKG